MDQSECRISVLKAHRQSIMCHYEDAEKAKPTENVFRDNEGDRQ